MGKTKARLRIAGIAAFVVLALFSWFIGYNQEAEWVRGVFAPDYEPMSVIISDLLEQGGSMNNTNPEFEKVLKTFRKLYYLFPSEDNDNPSGSITEIRVEISNADADTNADGIVIWSMFDLLGPPNNIQFYSDGKLEWYGYKSLDGDLQMNLHTVLWEEPLWHWRFAIFSIGFVLSFGFLYYAWILPGESATKEVGKDFILFWIFATITGYCFGTSLDIGLPQYYGGYGSFISIVSLQWLILRTKVPRARFWIYANIIGVVGIRISQMFFLETFNENLLGKIMLFGRYDLSYIGIQILSILLFAAPQWFVIRRYFFRSGWWIMISTVAYLIAELVFVNANRLIPAPGVPELFSVALLLTFAAKSIVIGIGLYWLLKNHRREALAV